MKNTPRVRFKGFSGEWEKESFEDFFLCFIPTNTLSRAALTFEKKEVRNIHYGDILIKFGSVLDVEKESIPFIAENTEELKSHLLKNGDIIFADAAEDETVGKCTELLNILDEKVVSGLHTIACRPNKSTQNGFLGYYLNSHSYRKQLLKLMQGIKVLSISKTSLTKTSLQTPTSQKEQTKIGNLFKNIDTLIAKNQQKYEKLTQMKKALLEKMFPKAGAKEPEIRFQGFRGEWEDEEFSKVLENFLPTNTLSRANLSKYGKIKNIHYGDILVKYNTILNINNVQIPYIKYFDIEKHKSHLLINGDIIFADAAEDEAVGKSIEIIGINNEFVVSGLHTIACRPNKKTCSGYLGYYLNSNSYRVQLLPLMQGIKVLSISKSSLLKTNLQYPLNHAEQNKIGELFRLLDKRIALQQDKIEKLKNMKRAFLEKMFV